MNHTRILSLAAAATLLASNCASAASLEVFDAATSTWTDTGTTTYTGPVTLGYLTIAMPCDSTSTVAIVGGVGQVLSTTLSGSTACTGSVVYNQPWPFTATGPYAGPNPPFPGAPTLPGPLYGLTIANVRIYAPPPLNANCPPGAASIAATINADGKIVFKQPLGPCVFQTRAGFALTASPAVRVVP